MKKVKKDLFDEFLGWAALISFIIFLGLIFYPDKKYTPKYSANSWFEHWTLGNEFKTPKLISFGKIVKVGKENYLLAESYCFSIKTSKAYKEIVNMLVFDKYYKIVTEKQLITDIKKECNDKK